MLKSICSLHIDFFYGLFLISSDQGKILKSAGWDVSIGGSQGTGTLRNFSRPPQFREKIAEASHNQASQLQSTAMETMEAVELEKQKHNNTKMEFLARLTKLEHSEAGQRHISEELNPVSGTRN
ncbi:Golgin candidate 2 [Vigna angularis]|uniref:Golgin candidate 2 n=1 Tax=Phaseolus angularis TaxID=3914 RepID=A0A8T0JQD3_PHAAN|nr:Golgin candidate 2 [Vigna angularis]